MNTIWEIYRNPTTAPAIRTGALFQAGNFLKAAGPEVMAAIGLRNIRLVYNFWSSDDNRLRALAEYRHRPISDGKNVELGMLLEQAVYAAGVIRAGGGVLSQCHAGRNRSGLFSALVVRELFGCTGVQAVEHVRARRPRALANPAFEKALYALGKPALPIAYPGRY